MSAKQILAAFAFVLLFAVPAAAAPLTIATREIKEEKAHYTIEVTYPKTGHAVIDRALEAWAVSVERDFRALAAEPVQSPSPWAVDLKYDIARNDDAMFAVVFTHYSYTGGAHPNTFRRTFNFLMPDGADVELPELFTLRGVQRISDISIAQLKPALTAPDGMSDVDWIKRGAGPNARNFKSFVLQPRVLEVFFDPYQVAAYAAGPQEVRIPLTRLNDAIRVDSRAPAASFECVQARSDVEQAICSSRDLARLDRYVAEAYAEKLMWADDDAKRAVIRQAQRDWLKQRNQSCLRVRQPIVACLTGVYQQRLRALGGP